MSQLNFAFTPITALNKPLDIFNLANLVCFPLYSKDGLAIEV